MKKSFLAIFLLISCLSCNAQTNEGQELNQPSIEEKDSNAVNQPHVDIEVNKEYDGEGNLIGYDSTYSYVYRSINGEYEQLDMDSLFNSFPPSFRKNLSFYADSLRDDFFDKDSLFYHGFFDDSFFQKRFRMQSRNFEEMFRKMDSLKNRLYKEKLPPEAGLL